ncbi:helix-turn-helix domain-containing protein [Lysinibacillus sphaericus]|uniref:helix-turn-helix domain-containing protein n=1 Tax=Lysinibacillus sphaericus TaxID=1421 RepID=UPI001A9EADB0|nr:helix-turn-helix domain-containing protein [Lysinibacillus sphaericus]QTB29064.1 helix-turn-helix domain-containing protein [Lysinibacillus sphaericus]
MKIEFDPIPNLEKQIEKVVISATEKAVEQTHIRLATKEWMSIQEACKYIGVSFNTFSKFRTMGLPVAEIDKVKRVSKKQIDLFLQKNSF